MWLQASRQRCSVYCLGHHSPLGSCCCCGNEQGDLVARDTAHIAYTPACDHRAASMVSSLLEPPGDLTGLKFTALLTPQATPPMTVLHPLRPPEIVML